MRPDAASAFTIMGLLLAACGTSTGDRAISGSIGAALARSAACQAGLFMEA